MAIAQTITDIPTPPSKADPTNFDARADAFLAALDGLATEVNQWATEANSTASSVNTAATNAATSATNATATAGATAYSAVATYDYPDTVIGSDGHAYRCIGTGVTGDDPVGSSTGDWQVITQNAQPPAVEITTGTTASDGTLYLANTSSVAFTLTLPATPVAGLSFVAMRDPGGDWVDNNLTIGRNGKLIEGLAEDMICDIPYDYFVLRYLGSANGGWRMFV